MVVRRLLASRHCDVLTTGHFARAIHPHRLAAIALITVLLSLGPLFNAALPDFFSPAEMAMAWLDHLVELIAAAAWVTIGYAVVDASLPLNMPLRLGALCAAVCGLCVAATVLLFAYYARGFGNLPPLLRVGADSLRWSGPAIFLVLIADVNRRALRADAEARTVEAVRDQIALDETEQLLALTEAQIEPHFLFNVLGNVRALYRTRPEAGAETMNCLTCYLRTALPRVRHHGGRLSDEIELVRAYLELFRVRMGSRLSFTMDVNPALDGAEFPPMLLLTLVENAIKHGLEPAGGGTVQVLARCSMDLLEVAVLDNGVGFASAAGSGTGIGLVNVRRQLAARYPQQGRLALESVHPHGARATIRIPFCVAGVG